MKGSAYRFFSCKQLKMRSCLEDAKVGNMPELDVLISIRVWKGRPIRASSATSDREVSTTDGQLWHRTNGSLIKRQTFSAQNNNFFHSRYPEAGLAVRRGVMCGGPEEGLYTDVNGSPVGTVMAIVRVKPAVWRPRS